MKKIIVVFGTRPEAIKMCPLIIQLRNVNELNCRICLTGQHREMLLSVMNVFGIEADYNLDIMEENQSLSSITERVLAGMNGILVREMPDFVLVHGDTTTSYAAALAAFYLGIPVGHVEAGLRTYDLESPFPEEFNRQSIDMIGKIFFAPTESAKRNLLNEGKKEEQIVVTGNTAIDALKYTVTKDYTDDNLKWAIGNKIILLTVHRRENLGQPMRNIFYAIKRILNESNDVRVIFPIHKNPKVREIARDIFGGEEKIKIIEPLDVVTFHNYIGKSYLILSDSGGIQEEAPSLGKPVLVLRNTTERPEGIECGVTRLVGTDEENIFSVTMELLNDQMKYQKMSHMENPYGDGYASERICEKLINELGVG